MCSYITYTYVWYVTTWQNITYTIRNPLRVTSEKLTENEWNKNRKRNKENQVWRKFIFIYNVVKFRWNFSFMLIWDLGNEWKCLREDIYLGFLIIFAFWTIIESKWKVYYLFPKIFFLNRVFHRSESNISIMTFEHMSVCICI